MKKVISIVCLLLIACVGYSQAYIKLEVERNASANGCDNKVNLIPYGAANGPYMITWWDNSWSPSSGLHAQDICQNKGLTVELVDTLCNHLRAYVKVLPISQQQVYLDTVIATLPSSPGMCNGSISFSFMNVQPGDTRTFGNSGSGGVTTATTFNGLCEDYYTYGIWRGGSLIAEVTVSLHYPPVTPCFPFKDSLVITPQSAPGACDAQLEYNTISFNVPAASPYYHSIYKPVGGGSVQVNSGVDTSYTYSGLCAGPYIVETRSYSSNNYFVSNKIFVDEPLLSDSVWGSPGSSQVDTIYLTALTNCGINYTFNVDSVYISNASYLGSNQYEFEIAVLQQDTGLQTTDTIYSYSTAFADTSHQLCFDITFFCADSTFKTSSVNQLHSYIYYPPSNGIITIASFGMDHSQIQVYPIPANGQMTVSGLSPGENEMSLYSIDGKLVWSKRVTSPQYVQDVSSVSDGMYILKAVHIETQSTYVSKLLIEHP
ncbi:MAG: T9SS type A sorting domain-containing protein [Flavobacteriales bacterium]|nr:T9SS type A sorting domain-containing protein [Flavobacteriales bacterium]